MAEYGPSAIRGIFKTVNASEPGVKDGGIVGDANHWTGYHRSRNALIAKGRTGDYSIQDARDKQGDGNAASAADLTMSDVLMRKLTARLVAAMRARDPRIVGKLREYGGTLDSKKVSAFRVEDQKALSFDSSHLWHIHLSIFRKWANDVSVCQGIAQVLLGIPLTPYVWDGKSFPGAERLQLGAEGPWVTWMGERLVAHGWTGYTSGPGPTLTTVDLAAVKWAQEQQGFTGADADGIAGAATWAWLAADPTVPPKPSEPVLYPAPTTKDVWQEKLVAGQVDSDSVWQLQNALRKLGFDALLTGAYDAQTIAAVKRYQASLGDKVQDGLVGPLQTARLFKDAGVTVTIIPKAEPTPVKPERFSVSMREWGGAAGRTLIQGAEIHPPSGTVVVRQADTVTGQLRQDIVFRFHDRAGAYKGARTIKHAGHGSSAGLESLGANKMRLWVRHAKQAKTGYITHTLGQTGVATFVPVSVLPAGDPSVDQDADVICIRNGNRFRGYRLSSALAGKTVKLWEFTIANWGKRFQGHLVKNDKVYVHRDVATKGASRAHVFDTKGKQVATLDTTGMGDEAEGFLVQDRWIFVVKRVGGDNPNRTIRCTPWRAV